MKWFRLWTDILDDHKLAKLTDVQFRYFVFLLTLAADQDSDGYISMTNSDICWRLRLDPDTLTQTKAKLESLEIIETHDNSIRFVNWEKRQPASTNSTDRVRRYRANQNKKQRNESLQNRKSNKQPQNDKSLVEVKRDCNGSETDVKRFRNVSETPPETETETETETEINTPLPPTGGEVRSSKSKSKPLLNKKQQQRFDEFYSAYPKKMSKVDAQKAFLSLNPDDKLQEQILLALELAKRSEGWLKDGGRYIPYPATWLRRGCWEDDVCVDSGKFQNGTHTGSARMDGNMEACMKFVQGD